MNTAACVVIGASAGGIGALISLFSHLSPTLRLPLLIVLHISEHRPTRLTEVFARHAARPVVFATDGTPIAPACIVIAPAGYHLLVEDETRLSLSIDPPVNHSRPSIDVLFETAARVFGHRLVAVLLTGASCDGQAGMRKVFEAGGRTIAQSPEEAHSRIMPLSAIRDGSIDHVLPLASIAQLINDLDRPWNEGAKDEDSPCTHPA